MTRLKWLFIGFVGGAMFGAASAKFDVAGPVKSKIGSMRGGCCTDDAVWGDGAPDDGAGASAETVAGAADADPAAAV